MWTCKLSPCHKSTKANVCTETVRIWRTQHVQSRVEAWRPRVYTGILIGEAHNKKISKGVGVSNKGVGLGYPFISRNWLRASPNFSTHMNINKVYVYKKWEHPVTYSVKAVALVSDQLISYTTLATNRKLKDTSRVNKYHWGLKQNNKCGSGLCRKRLWSTRIGFGSCGHMIVNTHCVWRYLRQGDW